MQPRIYRFVNVPVIQVGQPLSMPAQIGSPVPAFPVRETGPVEHPQVMTPTAPIGIPPMLPVNGSTLATEYLPEAPAVPAGV